MCIIPSGNGGHTEATCFVYLASMPEYKHWTLTKALSDLEDTFSPRLRYFWSTELLHIKYLYLCRKTSVIFITSSKTETLNFLCTFPFTLQGIPINPFSIGFSITQFCRCGPRNRMVRLDSPMESRVRRIPRNRMVWLDSSMQSRVRRIPRNRMVRLDNHMESRTQIFGIWIN